MAGERSSPRRARFAVVLFAALVASGLRPELVDVVVPPFGRARTPADADGLDRWPLRFHDDPTPRDLASFLATVRRMTKPGEKVALVFAPPHAGFTYVYWRASYVLAGRTVLLPEPYTDFDSADVVAAWERGFGRAGFTQVQGGERGSIWRNVR